MSAFRKSVLSVGCYQSPEGAVVVTPDRLKHWERGVKRIQSANYQIPVHWNHAELTNVDDLSPIHRLSATPAQAEKTVGRLVDFQVAADGKSAEIIIETLTPSAKESVESNAVFVSPVLFDEWQDGQGETYSDIIGSVDLVDFPVDNSQGKFEPTSVPALPAVIRMSTRPKQIFRLSTEASMTHENQPSDPPADDTPAQDDPVVPQSNSLLSEVITGLSGLKIVLPSDTNTENFLERLNTALMTAAAQTETPEEENTEVADPGAAEPQSPAIATMSTQINRLKSKIIEDGRKAARSKLDALLASGRCTPVEFDEQSKSLAVQRMSLTSEGEVGSTDVSKWIENREAIPVGACWDPEEKIKRMSTEATPAPEKWSNKPSPSTDEMKRQKKEMLRR